MKTGRLVLVPLLSLVFLTLGFAQSEEEGMIQNLTIKSGISFEYFTRGVDVFSKNTEGEWEEEDDDSRLKSAFLTLSIEFGLQGGFTFTPILGYCVSDYDPVSDYKPLVFRKLPFSIELNVGQIKGYLVGAELKKTLFSVRDFEVEASGQIMYYAGIKQQWSVSGLNVEGTVEGKPYWLRGTIGPYVVYKGLDYVSPYLGISYTRLWGKFNLEQTILDLTGEEEKKIIGKGDLVLSPGVIYKLTGALSAKGEASIIPRKNGVDTGIMVRILYSF